MMHDTLWLGSQSYSRQLLLEEAGIPFVTLPHHSSELEAIFKGDLESYVIAIAQHKMDSLILPAGTAVTDDGYVEKKFVLTADSLVQHKKTGALLGKPKDHDDAKRMLALARESEMLIMTGCCIRVYSWQNGAWHVDAERTWATPAYIDFVVPQEEVDYYLDKVPEAMFSAGAGILEGFGANYLRGIQGSFTGGRGLPMFEVRAQLRELGFRFC